MKKIVIIIVIICLCIGGFIIYNHKNMNDDIYMDIYNRYNDVDEGIKQFMNSDYYQTLDEEEKIKSVGQLLKIYKSKGVIKGLYYSEENKSYSFQYKDDSLGGVSLKEFDPMFN